MVIPFIKGMGPGSPSLEHCRRIEAINVELAQKMKDECKPQELPPVFEKGPGYQLAVHEQRKRHR